MALSISGGNGSPVSQGSTQSPQTSAGAGGPAAASSSKVQPGTATGILSQVDNASDGVRLTNTPLSVVSLNTTAQVDSRAEPTAAPPPRHFNPVLIVLVVGFAVLAAVCFWLTARSAKNTTI